MRLAILSALADPFAHADASMGERPALRLFAGKPVLDHQIDCAALLGCERILCLTGQPGPDLAAARAYAERTGLRFDGLDSLVRLATLVTAEDDVVVLADGVLPDRNALLDALDKRPGVASFSAEAALPLGFERLDADRAWSGALRMRGASVAKLADMPPDSDLTSSLLRIGLQSGVPVIDIGDRVLIDGSWQRRVDRQSSAAAERRWINRQVRPAPFAAPGRAIADRIALRLAYDAESIRFARAPHLTALLAASLAFALGAATLPVAGLAFLLIASFASAVAEMFDRVAELGAPPSKAGVVPVFARLAADALLIGLLALTIAAEPGWLRIALPLGLIAVLQLGAATAPKPLRDLYADRTLAIVVLLTASALGWTAVAVAGMMFLALAAMLWTARTPRSQITAD